MTRGGPPDPDQLLDTLDPEQREVATAPLGPMVVLAGAGTGKTRAITHRIAYGVASGAYPPDRVLAVTFTARAAGEMRTRLRGLGVQGVQARTFHAAALRQLQFFWPQAVGGAPPSVVAHKAPAVAEAAGRLHLRLDRTALRDVAAEIEWTKVSMLTAQTYPARARSLDRRVADLDPTAMARLLETYHEVCSERHVIDFEDVLLLTVGMLDEHPQIAAAVHQQYRHFVVDEYQDVNPLQQQLLELWRGERQDVCVVGDPAQSIYSFTGASASHLLDFPQRHPGARQVQLVRNYRSTPQVVHLANLVLGGRAGGRAGHTGELVAQAGDGPAPTLTSYPDDEAEAQGVADATGALLAEGVEASQIAILFRTNSQSEAVENALARRDIPYLVRGGERFFSRAEVRNAVVLLRGAVRADDPARPLGDVVRDVLSGAGWAPRPPDGSGAVRERWESLQALALLADSLATQTPGARLAELVVELDRRTAEQHAPTVQGITLASFHAAKGLEWDAVFLVGCSEGLLPITLADTPERIEEERRLLYVGLTRARRRLALSWAAARNPGGRGSRSLSRFLGPAGRVLGVPPESAGAAPSRRQRRRRLAPPRTCRTCDAILGSAAERKIGRCSDCPPTYDEQVFDALRAWRLGVAQESGVPAFVVFTDATLIAIAERTPADRDALAQISGVGERKLGLYGDAVLEILSSPDTSSTA
ncbi:ATP-dependent DNA helicase UvrD2 [Serinicoccus kebangsaanensis]|uniref:ATP-dependent DNA helicase UvrD2 n=1 Tax=Serinicoccus kebangsaanensis TaxID=2602069 RepID=UPI00124C840C|nr:ATP-dependent DNA helicase UvrD2 [Serinicoccus kebangsaanensis]